MPENIHVSDLHDIIVAEAWHLLRTGARRAARPIDDDLTSCQQEAAAASCVSDLEGVMKQTGRLDLASRIQRVEVSG